MGTVAETWAFTPPQPGAAACKAAWDGTQSLAVTVAATGAPVATFAGQSLSGLAAPLAQFAAGDPAGGAAVLGTLGFPAIDPTATDIQPDGTQGAGSGLLVPTSGHVHPVPGSMWVPPDNTWLGANADYAGASGGGALIAGTLYIQKLIIRQPTTITKLWYAVTALGSTTSTGSFVGLLGPTGTLLSGSADIVNSINGNGAVGWFGTNLTTPQSLQPGTYYAVFLSNLSVGQPSILRMTNTAAFANGGIATASAFRWAQQPAFGTALGNVTLASNATTSLTLCVAWS